MDVIDAKNILPLLTYASILWPADRASLFERSSQLSPLCSLSALWER